ncbi:glutathione s-transferase [Holotrichia oblita]|uniref:Glutathione s-transferase n=1 Tax=Holotrichia oblita TaxID=644536 RepID=A0ACB9TV76_HOLOL|nr:glutathione s-transferase [Holotrichia oblita]
MSDIKVTYFNGRGLGEVIRYLLKYGNIDFEDIRIEQDNWPALKDSTPFGQLPLYEENGKVTGQSVAIARYIAKKVNLAGDDEWQNLEIDAIADTITDLRLKLYPLYSESDAEKKATLKQALLLETIPYYFGRFDKYISKNNGYLAANKLSWADVYFAIALDLFNVFLEINVLEKYESLSTLKKKVEELPGIKEWIASRPETPF